MVPFGIEDQGGVFFVFCFVFFFLIVFEIVTDKSKVSKVIFTNCTTFMILKCKHNHVSVNTKIKTLILAKKELYHSPVTLVSTPFVLNSSY